MLLDFIKKYLNIYIFINKTSSFEKNIEITLYCLSLQYKNIGRVYYWHHIAPNFGLPSKSLSYPHLYLWTSDSIFSLM